MFSKNFSVQSLLGPMVFSIALASCGNPPPPVMTQPQIPTPVPSGMPQSSRAVMAFQGVDNQISVMSMNNQVLQTVGKDEQIKDYSASDSLFVYRTVSNLVVLKTVQGQILMAEQGVSDFKVSNKFFAYKQGENFFVRTNSGKILANDCNVIDFQVSNEIAAYRKSKETCPNATQSQSQPKEQYNVLHVVDGNGSQILRKNEVMDFKISDKLVATRDLDHQLSVYRSNGQAYVAYANNYYSGPKAVNGQKKFSDYEVTNELLLLVSEDTVAGDHHKLHVLDAITGQDKATYLILQFVATNKLIAFTSAYFQNGLIGQPFLTVVTKDLAPVLVTETFNDCQISDQMVAYRDSFGKVHLLGMNSQEIGSVSSKMVGDFILADDVLVYEDSSLLGERYAVGMSGQSVKLNLPVGVTTGTFKVSASYVKALGRF